LGDSLSKCISKTKIADCIGYLSGELSHQEICQRYEITFNKSACKSILNEWVTRFLPAGKNAFINNTENYSAHKELKDYSPKSGIHSKKPNEK